MTDPLGKGAARTLGCSCSELERSWSCAYHALEDLVHFQLMDVNYSRLQDVYCGGLPLVGRKDDPRSFVEKQDMIYI